MAVLKYKDSNGNYQPLVGINVQSEVVQTTGTSTTAVMSQKAVTDELGGKSDKADTVSDVSFDSSTNKLQKTIDGTTSDVCEILKKDGFYEDLHSGLADNLFGETQTSDRFLFRPTAGIQDIESGEPPVGGAAVRRIEGSAVAWNQCFSIPSSDISTTISGLTVTDNRDGSMTLNGTLEGYLAVRLNGHKLVIGHKYYVYCGNTAISSSLYFGYGVGEANVRHWLSTAKATICTAAMSVEDIYFEGNYGTFNNIKIYPMIIDLTLLFGAGNEPETVAAFEQWLSENIGLKSYYPYNAGELIPVKDYKVKAVGFNVWDEEYRIGDYSGADGNFVPSPTSPALCNKNFISVLPSTTYWMKKPVIGWVYFYDASKNYISSTTVAVNSPTFTTPTNAAYINFNMSSDYGTTYNNDICINLSYDDDKDGTYEEHWEHQVNIDVTKVYGKLNGSGNYVQVFPDGMKKVYEAIDVIDLKNGVANKRIGSIDLGSKEYTIWNGKFAFGVSDVKTVGYSIYSIKCSKYKDITASDSGNTDDKVVYQEANGTAIYFADSSYSTASDFATSLQGHRLYYELATPLTYTNLVYRDNGVDVPVSEILYAVDDYGTEELLLGNDSSVVSCTPKMSIKYGINAADTIASLPHSYVSSKHQSLNDSEQETARQNIGAASQHDMTVVKKQLELIDKKVENDYYVDMGLPSGVLWAKRNIFTGTGNDNGFAPSEYSYDASFFSWGNTDGHNPSGTTFDYDFGSSNDGPYASTEGAKLTGNIPLSRDAARYNCGEPWRTPTTEEFKELFNNCDFIDASGNVIASTQANKLITMSSVVGIRLKSKINGMTLFFPCCGFGTNTALEGNGGYGYCWSSSLYSLSKGLLLSIGSSNINFQRNDDRFYAFPIRPVM